MTCKSGSPGTSEAKQFRRPDWLERLQETVEYWKDKPFGWAYNDCCMFAARCVDEMTGSEWVVDLHSCYCDERTAKVYIEAEGSIEASVTKRLGEPVPRLQARRGDVCLVETPHGPGLGICVGAVALTPGEEGLVPIPLANVVKAWRID